MTDTQTRVPEVEPQPPRGGDAPALGVGGTVRFLWTQLTSMRTALVLLFALAVAAIPGSLVPQRTVSPFRVEEFIDAHPVLGPIYDQVGLFNVVQAMKRFARNPLDDAGFWKPAPLLARLAAEGRTFN